MTNITTINNKIQTTDNKIQARDKSFKPFGVYRNSVLSLNSTQIASDVNTRLLYKWLIDNNLYDDLVLAVGGEYGIQKTYVNTNWQVENAYDLSKFSNDAGQAITADQPKILSNGWLGENNAVLDIGNPESLQFHDNVTLCAWVKINNYKNYNTIIGAGILGPYEGKGIFTSSDSLWMQVRSEGKILNARLYQTPQDWFFLVGQYNVNTSTASIILNTSDIVSQTDTTIGDTTPSTKWGVFARYTEDATRSQLLEGIIRDAQVFRYLLTSEQITSYYNLTKGKYGY